MFVYIHLYTVKFLDIRVIAISYDLHLQLLVKTFVKATGQSNKLLRLCVLRLASLSLCF